MPDTCTLIMHPPSSALARAGTTSRASDAPGRQSEARAATARKGAARSAVVQVLNDALRAERSCGLQQRQHGAAARQLALPLAAEHFRRSASAQSLHAQRIEQRITELGGTAETPPAAPYGVPCDAPEAAGLPEMIQSGMSAAGVSIDVFCRLLALVGSHDPATQRLAEEIMDDGLQYAEELWNLRTQASTSAPSPGTAGEFRPNNEGVHHA